MTAAKFSSNKSLNVVNKFSNQTSHWIIGAESPLEECHTDKLSFSDASDMNVNFGANDKNHKIVGSKALLAFIMDRRLKDESCEDGCAENEPEYHTFWTNLFQSYVANCHDKNVKDDMVFYVKFSAFYTTDSDMTEVEVYRSNSPCLPSLSSKQINWEETVYLNLISHKFDYYVTCAICTRTGDKELQILSKTTQRVYASPSSRNMSNKGTNEEMTYPDIFYTNDNFEETMSDLMIRDSEIVCVELIAKDLEGNFQAVIFLGSVAYADLKNAYDAKRNISQKMSFGWFYKDKQRIEFLKMRGPRGKGHAEMAISRVKGSGMETPHQTPSIENLSENFSTDIGNRRMSDPNMTRNYYSYGGGLQRLKSRSENENVDKAGLSSCTEVLATNLEDELDDTRESYHGFIGKSFGQAWHWFKEQTRANSVALNCSLTYISLPWHRIIGDLLDPRKQPVLSRTSL